MLKSTFMRVISKLYKFLINLNHIVDMLVNYIIIKITAIGVVIILMLIINDLLFIDRAVACFLIKRDTLRLNDPNFIILIVLFIANFRRTNISRGPFYNLVVIWATDLIILIKLMHISNWGILNDLIFVIFMFLNIFTEL